MQIDESTTLIIEIYLQLWIFTNGGSGTLPHRPDGAPVRCRRGGADSNAGRAMLARWMSGFLLMLERVEGLSASETDASASLWRAATSRIQEFLAGPRWQPALVLAVVVILVGAVYFWQHNSRIQLEQYELTATDVTPDAQGVIEVAANGRDATLTVSGLPALSPEEQYQLWLIVDGQRASGAVFSVKDDGTATVTIDSARPLADYGAFGITIEPTGGSQGPTGDRVLGYNL